MFVDKARIYVRAGRGGDGCLSFRREKYVPLGGPDGGNGGSGGSVFIEASPDIKTLLDFTYQPNFKAEDGKPGQSKNKSGKSGEDLTIYVPCGTVVYKVVEGKREFVSDLVEPGQKILVAKGGRGGRGNASFKNRFNKAPKISEKGEPGENVILDLELKLIADVGFVGYPNAGKSTLLSKITSARPKIADYPFTTLVPNLGVCIHKNVSFVIADIPGLIEGAHLGRGLGDKFLSHIERTKLLIHILDIFGYENSDSYKNFIKLNKELKSFSIELVKKPMLVALNKIDLPGSEKLVKLFKKKMKTKKYKIYPISAVTGKGISALLDEVIYQLSKIKTQKSTSISKISEVEKYIFEPDFRIEKIDSRTFCIKGKKIENIVSMTNFEHEEAVKYFQKKLKKLGVERELRKKGIKNGDTVKIGKYEFEYKSDKTIANEILRSY